MPPPPSASASSPVTTTPRPSTGRASPAPRRPRATRPPPRPSAPPWPSAPSAPPTTPDVRGLPGRGPSRPPLVGEEGVSDAVEPPEVAVVGVLDVHRLAAHPEPLHQGEGRRVLREGYGRHPSYAELLEADADQLRHGLGRVAVSVPSRSEGPPQLRLCAVPDLGDLDLGPGVLDPQVQVADDLLAEEDDQREVEHLGLAHRDGVLLPRGRLTGQPAGHVGIRTIGIRRRQVAGLERTDREALGGLRPGRPFEGHRRPRLTAPHASRRPGRPPRCRRPSPAPGAGSPAARGPRSSSRSSP